MENKRKYRKLSVTLGVRIGIEILVLISVLELAGILSIKGIILRNSIKTYTDLLNAEVTGLTYRNSKFMQQLRMYTNSDVLKLKGYTTEDVVQWLTAHEKIRGGDFQEIFYVDMKTGIAYTDTGRVFDFSKSEPYIQISENQLSQYISNPFGTSSEDSAYYVCKCIKKNNAVTGFFAGTVSHETLEKSITAMEVGKTGFAFLLSGNGTLMAYKDDSLVMKSNFLNAKNSIYGGMDVIAEKMTGGKEGDGWVTSESGKDLIVYSPVKGTPWSLALVVPEKEVYEITSTLAFVQGILGFIIAIILLVSVYVSVYLALKPLKVLNENITEIASGKADLTKRIPVNADNEIGEVTKGFNEFVEKLQTIMMQIKESRTKLSDAGIEMHCGIDENTVSIKEILVNISDVRTQIASQAGSVDETASAVNEIASNIESLEKMISTQAAGVTQASAAVEEMIGNISSVNNSVEKMAISFENLEGKAVDGNTKQKQMSQKIALIEEQSASLQDANKVIASIAQQTNLLAMNAAIEAAHAGAAGRGFSVVADEIRKLSETSSAQSKRIGEQLKEIKESIQTVVDSSNETQQTFDSVSESIKSTDQIVRLIKGAMEEQNEGSKQIVDALRDMSNSTSEVKSASEEMSEGNKTILEQVKNLKDATDVMKQSVSVMASGAEKIGETGKSLDLISGNMKDAIKQIGNQIDSFQV